MNDSDIHAFINDLRPIAAPILSSTDKSSTPHFVNLARILVNSPYELVLKALRVLSGAKIRNSSQFDAISEHILSSLCDFATLHSAQFCLHVPDNSVAGQHMFFGSVPIVIDTVSTAYADEFSTQTAKYARVSININIV